MELILDDVRLDRGDVDDLMANRRGVFTCQRVRAGRARVRLDALDLVNVLRRSLGALLGRMARLGSALLAGPLLRRARLPPRRVGGGWLARRPRRLGLLGLQPLNLATELLNNPPQLSQLGDEHLAGGAVRVRLDVYGHPGSIGARGVGLALYPGERLRKHTFNGLIGGCCT